MNGVKSTNPMRRVGAPANSEIYRSGSVALVNSTTVALSGAWTQIVDPTYYNRPMLLTGMTCVGGSNSGGDHSVEIAVGAAGSESVILALRDSNGDTGNSRTVFEMEFPMPMLIPAGTRFAGRFVSPSGTGYTLYATLTFKEVPTDRDLWDKRWTTQAPGLSYPAAANAPVAINSISNAGYTAWTQIIPAATLTYDVLITHVLSGAGLNDLRMDLGVGAAAAEVLAGRTSGGYPGYPVIMPLHRPFILPAGSRLAARAWKMGFGTVNGQFRVIHVRA